jgi:hypothetical protein
MSGEIVGNIKKVLESYKQLDDRWFALEKAGYISSLSYLYGLLGKKDCLRFAPKLFIKKHLNTLINILNK